MSSSQDSVKDSLYGGMIPPTSNIPGSYMPPGLPGTGVFNPLGVPQQGANDKGHQSADAMESAAELALQGRLRMHNIYECQRPFVSHLH